MADITMEKTVLSEFNLTHESLDEGVEHLITWIQKQPHLPDLKDKVLLKAFIVGSKSVERAKEKLDKYYTARAKYPQWYANRDPLAIKWPAVEKMIKLPGVTPSVCTALLLLPPGENDGLEQFDFHESCKVFLILLDAMYRTDPIIAGHYLILDCKTLSVEYAIKCVNTFTAASFNVYQGSLPSRIKGMICINASSAADFFVNNVMKPFLSKKIYERVFVHAEDGSILTKYFPQEMIPSEYGGSALSIPELWEKTKKDLEDQRDWFLKEGIEKADEALRPKPENDAENVQGTFRKLNVE